MNSDPGEQIQLPATMLRVVYGSLAATFVASALYVLLLRQTPQPAPVQTNSLKEMTGYSWQSQYLSEPQSSRLISTGRVILLDARRSSYGGKHHSVSVVPVRTLNQDNFELGAMREWLHGTGGANFAWRDAPKSVRAPRKLESDAQVADHDSLKSPLAGQLDFGWVGDHPAAQACITTNGTVTARKDKLVEAALGPRPQTYQERAMLLLGFTEPVRWECALVTLSMEPSATVRENLPEEEREKLVALWLDLLKVWRSANPWP